MPLRRRREGTAGGTAPERLAGPVSPSNFQGNVEMKAAGGPAPVLSTAASSASAPGGMADLQPLPSRAPSPEESRNQRLLLEHTDNADGAAIRPLPQPAMPTAAEIARHEVDHCPYQSWCRSCVAGRGKADAHFAHQGDESNIPCVACDYAFMGEKNETEEMTSKNLPILIHKFIVIDGLRAM